MKKVYKHIDFYNFLFLKGVYIIPNIVQDESMVNENKN